MKLARRHQKTQAGKVFQPEISISGKNPFAEIKGGQK